ncbi:MAG: hypothetical protein AAB486_03110, partial [Patescibacteria group bacterium]
HTISHLSSTFYGPKKGFLALQIVIARSPRRGNHNRSFDGVYPELSLGTPDDRSGQIASLNKVSLAMTK